MYYICDMNKNYLYLLVLLILGCLTYYFFVREPAPDYNVNEANFTVKNIEDVSTILLTNLNGDKIKLTKENGEWMANDTVEVIQNKVEKLLKVLHTQEPLEPVRIGWHDEVIKEMANGNTKVEVYCGEKKTHTFYVCKNTAPNNMTYMLTEGARRPYIVKRPLDDVFVGVYYNADINDWRSHKIMHASADEIEMIDVAYKDSTQYSFHLINEKGKTPVVTGQQVINLPLNVQKVNSYLRAWDSIYCLGFEQRNRIKDTIITQGHVLATVQMKKINKPVQTLVIYFKPISKGTKGILQIGDTQYDFDVFMGFLNNKDLMVIDRHFSQIMLRSYPEFFESNSVSTSPKP